jgi:hypothetical protein
MTLRRAFDAPPIEAAGRMPGPRSAALHRMVTAETIGLVRSGTAHRRVHFQRHFGIGLLSPSWFQKEASSFPCSGISTAGMNPIWNVPMQWIHQDSAPRSLGRAHFAAPISSSSSMVWVRMNCRSSRPRLEAKPSSPSTLVTSWVFWCWRMRIFSSTVSRVRRR